jgi:hypothetical protein
VSPARVSSLRDDAASPATRGSRQPTYSRASLAGNEGGLAAHRLVMADQLTVAGHEGDDVEAREQDGHCYQHADHQRR